MGQIEVGREQLTVQAELFALAAGGQLFLPGGLFADGAFVHVVDRLVEFLALGAQALSTVFFGIVALQHRVEGRPLPDRIDLAVLPGPEECKLHRFAVRGRHTARTAAVGVDLLQLVDGCHQGALLLPGQLIGQQVFAVECAPGGFAADHRADSGHRLVQGIRHGQVPLAGRCHDGSRTHGQKIRAGRFGRHGVGQAGQQLPDVAVLKIDPLEGVDDPAVLHQHQIGVAPHQLRAEDVPDQVAHLVGALELEVDDAVARLHPDIQQLAAGEMLAHQHAEGRRGLRVLEALLGQADPRGTAAGRQQQAVRLGAGAQGQHQFIAGRLKQFCDLRIGQSRFQFCRRQRQRCSIQSHILPSLSFFIYKYRGLGSRCSPAPPVPGTPPAAFRPRLPSPGTRWRSAPPR